MAKKSLPITIPTHRHWEKQLNQERQQRRRLEETVEALGNILRNTDIKPFFIILKF